MSAEMFHVDTDWASFDPWRIQPVSHTWGSHPLLQFDALVELGQRLERSAQTFSFKTDARADANFNTVKDAFPHHEPATDTLRRIADAHAWMLLRHVQTDAVYRQLVDAMLDGIKPQVDRKDPGMCYRAGWIFVSSPQAVTPFHIDQNHVLLLQLFGTKTVYVWDADDTEVVSDHARAYFLDTHSLDLVQWREDYRARAQVFELGPGMGVYMPLTSPHMVEIGAEPSVAMSVSYNTDASRRRSLQLVLRERLHELHVDLPPIGRYPLLDRTAHVGASAAIHMHQLGRRLTGHVSISDGAPYANAH